jgi:acetoin utilization protein AcuB
MTHRPTAILHTASVRAALAVMLELDVRHLPVVNEDHELVGMLSDRDLRGLPHVHRELDDALAVPGAIELDEPVTTLMSADVIAAEPADDLAEVLEIMLEHRIGAVPIVSPERRLVGIVSYLDALRAYQRDLVATSPS